jgi:hypothetical protein
MVAFKPIVVTEIIICMSICALIFKVICTVIELNHVYILSYEYNIIKRTVNGNCSFKSICLYSNLPTCKYNMSGLHTCYNVSQYCVRIQNKGCSTLDFKFMTITGEQLYAKYTNLKINICVLSILMMIIIISCCSLNINLKMRANELFL